MEATKEYTISYLNSTIEQLLGNVALYKTNTIEKQSHFYVVVANI